MTPAELALLVTPIPLAGLVWIWWPWWRARGERRAARHIRGWWHEQQAGLPARRWSERAWQAAAQQSLMQAQARRRPPHD